MGSSPWLATPIGAGRSLGKDDARSVGGFVFYRLQGLVGLIEREDLDLGLDADFAGAVEIVARVLASHVGYAADLALAPEKAVVVEGGHLVEVDGVDGDDAALAKARECADDDGSAGGEGDGAIELDWRSFVFVADPLCAEFRGLGAVIFPASGDIDLAVPIFEDLNGLRGRGSKAKETDRVTGLGVGDAEAAKADDAGAEERGSLGIFEGVRERVDEVGANQGVLSVASVDGVASKGWVVAEIFFVVEAESAGAGGPADPGDPDACSFRELGRCAIDDLSDDLMAEDERFL